MKLECRLEDLKKIIPQLDRITGKNLTLPILNSVLLVASGKSLKMRATNLSLGIEVEITAKIEKEGMLAVPGGVLNNVFSTFVDSESVSLEGVNGNLVIKTKKNNIKIKGQPHDDFPTIPKITGSNTNIESHKLVSGIKSVYYSASISDIKPEISSVYIYTLEDNIYFVSTDSFRLAEKKIKTKGIDEIVGIIIPYKNITEVLRVFDDVSGVVNITFNKNQISFSLGGIYMTSRVVDGIFPDYQQIIPKKSLTEAIVLKQDLLNALKISNIFSGKFNQINLSIKTKEKIFEFSSTNNDIGENKTQVPSAITGEDIDLSFNYKYFLDCLQSITTDSVSVKFSGPSSPIVVTPVSDYSFLYLIMPINR